MKLYSYWRSTTSYRIRVALSWKGLAYEYVAVDLLSGAQRDAGYAALNPVMGVPTLEVDGRFLTQSMAILDYLEAECPEPALMPRNPFERARALSAALVMATDTHPLNNLKVGQKLKSMGHSQEEVISWMNGWTRQGLVAFQRLIDPKAPFSFGETPTWPDICLVAQLYNAHRWGADLAGLRRLLDIESRCLELPAFQAAHPDSQPDAS